MKRSWMDISEHRITEEMTDKPVRMYGLMVRADEGGRRVTFRASTSGVDRHKTRIKPEGLDTSNFEKNPIFLWGHDGYGGFFGVPQMDHVLGRIPSFVKGQDAFDIDVDFAPEEVNPKSEQALRMVKAKFLNAVSIGFIPRQIVRDLGNEDDVPTITKSELLEVSLVPIPSNPDALALSRSMMDFDIRSTESARMGWICRHGQFYANPTQAESCHGHDREAPPADAVDSGADVRKALSLAVSEFAFERSVKSGIFR